MKQLELTSEEIDFFRQSLNHTDPFSYTEDSAKKLEAIEKRMAAMQHDWDQEKERYDKLMNRDMMIQKLKEKIGA